MWSKPNRDFSLSKQKLKAEIPMHSPQGNTDTRLNACIVMSVLNPSPLIRLHIGYVRHRSPRPHFQAKKKECLHILAPDFYLAAPPHGLLERFPSMGPEQPIFKLTVKHFSFQIFFKRKTSYWDPETSISTYQNIEDDGKLRCSRNPHELSHRVHGPLK